MDLLLMAIKIIEGREEPEDQNLKENKKDRKKKRARERKSLSYQLEGEVMKFSLQYLYSEILQHFDKGTMNLPSGPSQTPGGLQQLESGLVLAGARFGES